MTSYTNSSEPIVGFSMPGSATSESLGTRLRDGIDACGSGIRKRCSTKRMIVIIFLTLAIVVIGLLAELRARWEERRVDSLILANTTVTPPTTPELPFWSP